MPPSPRSSLVRLALPLVAVVGLAAVLLGGYRWGSSSSSTTGSDGGTPPATGAPTALTPQPVDTGFALDMLDHHQQAREMAVLALNRETSPPVRTMAIGILSLQQFESGQFTQFLVDRGLDVGHDPGRTAMAWMGEPVPMDRMPGLATDEQMGSLRTAVDNEFDRRFLELMITHHEGGVHMAEFAAERAETEQLRDLAARIVTDQRREITDMQQLLGG